MIISHKHKFIFIKTKKTAGTSIEIALSSICGKDDIITPISPNDEDVRRELGYRTAQNYLIPFKNYSATDYFEFIKTRRKKKFYNHISAKEIKENIDENIWNTYYKFAFDRNPYDKIVSLFYWRKADAEYKTIAEFLKSGVLSRIQGYDIYSIDKLVAVDKVYKYENLNESLIDISKK
ncbi:MAG: sulfotransferase family 2 domain-containing protein [Bacteroidales bacterium]|nr:sulfotransferase family 2 domain-containing protein [Bacteroidales bacterium]